MVQSYVAATDSHVEELLPAGATQFMYTAGTSFFTPLFFIGDIYDDFYCG